MRHARWAVCSAVAVTILAASTASAQDFEARRLNVSPYVGVFLLDDEQLTEVAAVEVDPGAILGARIGYAITSSWQVEAGYGFAALETEPSEFDEADPEDVIADLDAQVWYGAIIYSLAYREIPTALLLTAGYGVLILEPEGGDRVSDPMLDLGVGFTHPIRSWITIRGDARDHMSFCSAEPGGTSACQGGDELLHNFEVSVALQFWIF